jgi:hypothetical protein
MSQATIYLAKLFGLFLLILDLSMFVQRQNTIDTWVALVHSAPLIYVVSLVTIGRPCGRVGAYDVARRRAAGRRNVARLDYPPQGRFGAATSGGPCDASVCVAQLRSILLRLCVYLACIGGVSDGQRFSCSCGHAPVTGKLDVVTHIVYFGSYR